ncbi:MAG: HAD-IA family hydrolase [Candidatus Binataceae bacterium]|nr:HAD-IA family hydrolase [Candidatus Binataceae bacterium]
MLRAVFFDAAGTLFDPREPIGESYARVARGFGVETSAAAVSAAFRRAFAETPGLAFGPGYRGAELRRMEREWWRGVVRASFAGLGEFTDFDAYFEALFDYFADPANWQADPEAAPTLARLKQAGYALGVISNFDYRVRGILDGLGLGPYFDSVTISSEAGWAKPAREIFRTALERQGVAAGEALHVGDSLHLDIAGAEAAGIAAILIDREAPARLTICGRTAHAAALGAVVEAARAIPFP